MNLCHIISVFALPIERMIAMNLSQMQYYKQQYGYSYDRLSQLTGIPKGTIQKIFTGVTKSPRYEKHKGAVYGVSAVRGGCWGKSGGQSL